MEVSQKWSVSEDSQEEKSLFRRKPSFIKTASEEPSPDSATNFLPWPQTTAAESDPAFLLPSYGL